MGGGLASSDEQLLVFLLFMGTQYHILLKEESHSRTLIFALKMLRGGDIITTWEMADSILQLRRDRFGVDGGITTAEHMPICLYRYVMT